MRPAARSWTQEYLGLPSHESASPLLAASVVFHPSIHPGQRNRCLYGGCFLASRPPPHTVSQGNLVPFLARSADLVRRGKRKKGTWVHWPQCVATRRMLQIGLALCSMRSLTVWHIAVRRFAKRRLPSKAICADDQLSETTNWRPCVALLSRCHLCRAAPERMQHF